MSNAQQKIQEAVTSACKQGGASPDGSSKDPMAGASNPPKFSGHESAESGGVGGHLYPGGGSAPAKGPGTSY